MKRSSVRCFDSFLETLNLHKEDVSNDFPECYNSGFVEGLNDKIKVTSSLAAMVCSTAIISFNGSIWTSSTTHSTEGETTG
ncbi:transposase [uncultured Thiohalocapsa sp.]|uniref:transposase n=1 Tax=uncultured Thiohalocapsa sp. TaxID=768990 RepID=UPI0025E8A18D|nr:transposase [uncultured Thiohalocapsa sp.]